MSVRVVGIASALENEVEKKSYDNMSFTQRETTVNGYTFHWGVNERRNFLDDGVGLAHAAFSAIGIVQDTIPFGDSRS